MCKLSLKKAKETEIKLPTSIGSLKKQESSRKISAFAFLTMSNPLTVWITANCGKFLNWGGNQINLPASWEICMLVKKQQLEPHMEQQTGCKLGKDYMRAAYCHHAYLIYMWNAGLDEAQAGIKIARRNNNNLRHADDTTLMAESEEELKILLMKVRGERKSWLKAQHTEN